MAGVFLLIFSFLRGERERGEQRVFLGANPGLCKTISAPERIFNLQQRSLLAEANLEPGKGVQGAEERDPRPATAGARPLQGKMRFSFPAAHFGTRLSSGLIGTGLFKDELTRLNAIWA